MRVRTDESFSRTWCGNVMRGKMMRIAVARLRSAGDLWNILAFFVVGERFIGWWEACGKPPLGGKFLADDLLCSALSFVWVILAMIAIYFKKLLSGGKVSCEKSHIFNGWNLNGTFVWLLPPASAFYIFNAVRLGNLNYDQKSVMDAWRRPNKLLLASLRYCRDREFVERGMNDFKVSMARFEEDPKRNRKSLATATKLQNFPSTARGHEIVSLKFLIYLMRLVARASQALAKRPDDSIVPQLTAACKNRPKVEQWKAEAVELMNRL